VDGFKAALGTDYDWRAIAEDAMKAFGIPLSLAWARRGGLVPGHVVCSSLAAYYYAHAGLACPPGGRLATPGDWLDLIYQQGWQRPGRP